MVILVTDCARAQGLLGRARVAARSANKKYGMRKSGSRSTNAGLQPPTHPPRSFSSLGRRRIVVIDGSVYAGRPAAARLGCQPRILRGGDKFDFPLEARRESWFGAPDCFQTSRGTFINSETCRPTWWTALPGQHHHPHGRVRVSRPVAKTRVQDPLEPTRRSTRSTVQPCRWSSGWSTICSIGRPMIAATEVFGLGPGTVR